mgnify:CR=1 FL=1
MKKTEFDYFSKDYDGLLKKSFPSTFEEVNYFSTYKIKLIHDSFISGMSNIDNILKDFTTKYESKVDSKLIETYLNERIIYKLTEKHLDGINLFHELSAKFAKWEKRSFNNIL